MMVKVGAKAGTGAGTGVGNRAGDARIDQVVRFWFEELTSERWFAKDDALDHMIAKRFGDLHAELSAGIPQAWRDCAEGCLAAILVLDQFSRNLYRGGPRAFAFDDMARAIAKSVVEKGWDRQFDYDRRTFLYLPFTHAEDRDEQDRSIALFAAMGGDPLERPEQHKAIIDRFGRFPHRNAALGRESTDAEQAFLQESNSSF